MNSITDLYKKFIKIPADYTDTISNKNRRLLKFFFYFGIVFVLVCLPFLFGIYKVSGSIPSKLVIFYYVFLMGAGIAGLVLLKTKIPSPVLILYTLIGSEVLITIHLFRTPFVNAIVIFIGVLFCLIMLLEINPLIFVSELSLYFIFLYFSVKFGGVVIDVSKSNSFLVNALLFFGVMIILVFWKRKYLINEFNRDKELNRQKEKTEELLHNLLPDSVIDQLKTEGSVPPKMYENMTVLISDIVNFTKISTTVEPYFLINELNQIFTQFDKITSSHDCIRIKTIGDAYMAVCGLPEKNDNHAENLLLCARDYISWLSERNKSSEVEWNIRIGLSSGKAIAGIIGKKKYLYDILGTTVENAVRLQNSCSPMHIKLSSETYNIVKDKMQLPEIVEIDNKTPVKPDKNPDKNPKEEKVMKESELKKGDILLYSYKKVPDFKPLDECKTVKDFIKENFGILIDKLIIWSENSNTTHAALAYDFTEKDNETKCVVAEATLPYCQLRSPAYPGEAYKVTVHRLPDGLDGSVVLNELPPLSEDNKQNNSYAMAQATVAALICLFRTRVADDHEKAKKLMIFLKFIGYALGQWIEPLLPTYKDDKTPFFCSQLAAWCYNMTALHLHDERYRVKTSVNSKIGDTLIDYLIKNDIASVSAEAPSDALGESQIDLYSPEVIYSLCDILGDDAVNTFAGAMNLNEAPALCSKLKADSDGLKNLLPSMKSLLITLMKMFGTELKEDKEELAKQLIDFQSSFIMPCDLENVFETVGEVTNA